jgi:hypothetical protein
MPQIHVTTGVLFAALVFSGLAALLVRAAFSQAAGTHRAGRAKLVPTRPVVAGGEPSHPVRHVGATEGYGQVLHRLRDADIAPELMTPAEQVVADHRALAGIDRARDAFEMAVGRVLDQLTAPLDAQTRLRLASAAEQTGELPVAELRALLAAEDQVGVSA